MFFHLPFPCVHTIGVFQFLCISAQMRSKTQHKVIYPVGAGLCEGLANVCLFIKPQYMPRVTENERIWMSYMTLDSFRLCCIHTFSQINQSIYLYIKFCDFHLSITPSKITIHWSIKYKFWAKVQTGKRVQNTFGFTRVRSLVQ